MPEGFITRWITLYGRSASERGEGRSLRHPFSKYVRPGEPPNVMGLNSCNVDRIFGAALHRARRYTGTGTESERLSGDAECFSRVDLTDTFLVLTMIPAITRGLASRGTA